MSPPDPADTRKHGPYLFSTVVLLAASIVWGLQCSGAPHHPAAALQAADQPEPAPKRLEQSSPIRVASHPASAAEALSILAITVLEKSGQPLGDAHVFFLEDERTRFIPSDSNALLARTNEYGLAQIAFESRFSRGIFVARTGFVSSSVLYPTSPGSMTVHLDRGMSQKFRVRDHSGQPVPGVRIAVTGYSLRSPALLPSGTLLSGPYARDAVHHTISDSQGEAEISGLVMQPHAIGVVHPTHGWSIPVCEAIKISKMIPGPPFEIVMKELLVALAEFKGDVVDVCNMGYETDASRPLDSGIGHEFSIPDLYRRLRREHPNALCNIILPMSHGTPIIARWDVFARHSGWHVFRQPMQPASVVEPTVFELPRPAQESQGTASGIVRLTVHSKTPAASIPIRQVSVVRAEEHHSIRVVANVSLDGSPSHLPPGTYKPSIYGGPVVSAAFKDLGSIEVRAGVESNVEFTLPFDLCSCRLRVGSTVGSPGSATLEITHPQTSVSLRISDGDEVILPSGVIRYVVHFTNSGEFDLLPLNGEATVGSHTPVLDLGITRLRGENGR